jgi:diguanylate cyclase (GGDEF)-like protein/PAS domain S-box-containing protein
VRIETTSYVETARKVLFRVALIYLALIGLWVLIHSGIPISVFADIEISQLTWLQTFNAWFFVAASGWLLYMLVNKGLVLVAQTEESLRLRDRSIEASGNGIFITSNLEPDRPIIYVNRAFEQITGYTAAEAVGRNPRFLQANDSKQAELEAIRLALKEERPCRTVLRNYRRDGSLFWNEIYISPVRNPQGVVTHYVGVQNDITQARNYQEELARQQRFDTLTGLANRNLLVDRIDTAIARAQRNGRSVAIALLDLDNFHIINETLGYKLGDQLLRLVAERLTSNVRTGDTVARMGGDDFAIVFIDQGSETIVGAELPRVMHTFERPFVVEGREIFVTVSIGVVLSPLDGDNAELLLKNAETAMYLAKDQGRNSYRIYAAKMNARMAERLDLDTKLRRALEQDELQLHYQPQLDLRTNCIVGVEALLRWIHPEIGMIPLAKIIPLAEETGLIVPIGEWVIRTACRQNLAWQKAGLEPIVVAVNISARQFRHSDLAKTVDAILKETGLEARYLELELTESAIMHNPDEVISTLTALKAMGVKLSIDDFGTGYSSLTYLKRFPVDRLKIDRSFLKGVPSDTENSAIAQAVINLGHSMKLRVVAEGVENAEQLAFLRAHQCDEQQGFLFSKPLPAEEFAALHGERRLLTA